MGIEKQVLSMRLDEELIEKLKKLAESENRTLSNYIETLLKKHIDNTPKK
ncbi:MAG: ribbon-helix-helix domain-containing protein [Firmicutes bacterium]|nr:ribbon-helix-helix domain-containing protein [Bacillota bacterium]